MKKLASLAALFGAATLMTGCNTVAGMGKDLQAAGSAISGSAKAEEPKKSPAPAPAASTAPAPAPMAAPPPAPMAAPAPAAASPAPAKTPPPPPQPVRR